MRANTIDLSLPPVTHPENGTTSFLNNAEGSVQRKVDAKGQKMEFPYNSDGVVAAREYGVGGEGSRRARVDYSFGPNPFDGA